MSGISRQAAVSLENRIKYNDGTELNSDFDLNLYECEFRSYDPQIGRFQQIDPLADLIEEISPFVYCNNNPVMFNDPFGLMKTSDPNAGFEGHNPNELPPVIVHSTIRHSSGPVNFAILMQINPNGNRTRSAQVANNLNLYMQDFGIDNNLRLAHFLAQISHETDGFNIMTESWHYRRAGILATWPSHFNESNVDRYVNSPAVFDKAYENRMGNGNEASRDGSKYKGRGLIQLTGKDSYTRFTQWYQSFYHDNSVNFVDDPDLISTNMKFALISALWEFSIDKRLNIIADQDNVNKITLRINGGFIGIDDRKKRLKKAKEALGIMP